MKFRKILSLALAASALSAVMLTSCGNETKDPSEADGDKVYNIGICQLVTHDALDAATEGFKQALIDKLGRDHVKFDEQNAANSSDVCGTIINSFVSSNVDLILANATPALQTAANATKTIPILGTSVTEYGVALSIDNFNGTVGENISGTSDLAPLEDQAQMILDLVPSAKTVGLLYCSAEQNSEYQVKVVKEYLDNKGIKTEVYSFSGSEDVALVTETASSECDALYIPTDNTAASCSQTIGNIIRPKKIPAIVGEVGICRGCGIATLSISYEKIGYTTGEMAAKILTGEAKIEEMPIAYDDSPVKLYNPEICEEYGITPPDGYAPMDAEEEPEDATDTSDTAADTVDTADTADTTADTAA
ncbi:MAG: ABC transporter substrate-binding protein [Clostridiales bacterium]|nr:ABC transporter substrate-binding protein [Clostridiales bacterium]